ncbi:MAG: ferredoxin family protein [Anaerolineales bacterium]|nr:ferredoxin family protein [Anaerolineales bacterium]
MPWLTGYPRERVEWYPTIDPDKCVKCGMCLNCGKNVYNWTASGAVVARPYDCVVGCNTCENLCMGDAISFPDIEQVRALYKREHIWTKVKHQLQAEGKLVLTG